ncbi:protein of unknown function [Mariniphaga anaerophila]|uniref:DUF4296 domain-containing protein n=1 Tax=Mariniphaga anaerophila TaxID=1484053 RepID=A0A1M5CDI5_9BACT|nr:DUF4296 domain-containing protein [Mariniphaga anaerophila]SHF52834.1 protein of unknown function [Mariniphaga anaerophila]
MRYKTIVILFLLALGIYSCSKPVVDKPAVLINENQMIEMLADMHLAESAFNTRRNRDSLVTKSSSTDFYYSILDKYHVPDSVFEQSFVFYAAQPRKFEKMYRQSMNKLSEMEQEYSGRKIEPEELELQKPRK